MWPKYIQPGVNQQRLSVACMPAHFLVAAADKGQRPVDLVEKLGRSTSSKPASRPMRRLLEGARQQVRDFLHRDPAGEFPRHRAAHAVAHGEDKIGVRRSSASPILPR